MSNLEYCTKSVYKLENPDDRKFRIIKAYRDMNVFKSSCKILEENPELVFYLRVKFLDDYQKCYKLKQPVYERLNNYEYVASTIFYHRKDLELYLADAYVSCDGESVCILYGTEKRYSVVNASFSFIKKSDFKDIYKSLRLDELIKERKEYNLICAGLC